MHYSCVFNMLATLMLTLFIPGGGGGEGGLSTCHIFIFCHSLAQYSPRYAIVLTVVISDFSTLSGSNLQILIPKRYAKNPAIFIWETPPPLPPGYLFIMPGNLIGAFQLT